MRSRLPNTKASYLPSKKSQKVSEERIAKINELYENIKRSHRDSVVSNNSTSVASQEQASDNCIPISGLDYKLANVNHIDQLKVKHENDTTSPFRTDQISTPAQSRPLIHAFRASEPHAETNYDSRDANNDDDGDDDDDDYEAELRFTPKLKSRRSLKTMRRLSDSERDRSNSSNESYSEAIRTGLKVRKSNRGSSLRRTLGDPLPLPYVSGENSLNSTPNSSVAVSTKKSLEDKRQLMERKWRTLVARDKQLIEKRFAALRQENSAPAKLTFGDESLPAISITSGDQQDSAISELSKEIMRNREKLDDIIKLLSQRPDPTAAPAIINGVSKETQFWTICIIILLFCNYYVYHYF